MATHSSILAVNSYGQRSLVVCSRWVTESDTTGQLTLSLSHDKLTANIILKIKLKVFPLRTGTKQRCSLSSLLFNIVLEILATAIRREKQTIKGSQIGKEEVKLFADNMIQLNIKIQLETGKATSTGIFPLKIYFRGISFFKLFKILWKFFQLVNCKSSMFFKII